MATAVTCLPNQNFPSMLGGGLEDAALRCAECVRSNTGRPEIHCLWNALHVRRKPDVAGAKHTTPSYKLTGETGSYR